MTTTATTTADDTILAIDLGKYKSVACVDRSADDQPFTTVPTRRAELARLIERHRPDVILLEACRRAGWVGDRCAEQGVPCRVANTAREAWKFKHRKRTTDRDDAQRLAQLYLLDPLPTVTLPPASVRQWRALIAGRQVLVGRRIAVQNRIRALFVTQGLPAPRGAEAWAATGLAGMATWAKPLADGGPDELWRGLLELSLTEYRQLCELIDQAQTKLDALGKQHADVVRLPTTPGLGPRTAETVAADLHDAARFETAKQVSADSGLVPRQHQSGEMDRRGRSSKRGAALLRTMLVECAWCLIRYNAWARGIYQRLTGGGQRRKQQAIVALARKILVRCWALLRDRKPWHDPPTGPQQTLPPSKQRRQAQAQERRPAQGAVQPAEAAT
jgi:transposase